MTVFLYGLVSCQKEIDSPEESPGILYDKLLKTVSRNVSGSGMDITTLYTYDAAGKINDITRTFLSPNGTPETQKDTYYRNSAGLLDSITYRNITYPQGAGFYNVYRTEFRYDNNGLILYSVNRTNVSNFPTDSAVYTYQGNRVVQRIVYRSVAGASSPPMIIHFDYNYDAAGNLSGMEVAWSNPNNSRKSCIYTYDNKPNSLPVMEYEHELYGNWIKAFDNIFTTANNILSRRTPQGFDWDWGEKDFEYRYSSNNKPVYQKVKHTGTTQYYETYYYYD